MRIFYIECTSEELRANRTIADAITDAMSDLVQAINDPAVLAAAMRQKDQDQDPEEEEDE